MEALISYENEVAICVKDLISNCPLAFLAYEFLLHYMPYSSDGLDLNKYIERERLCDWKSHTKTQLYTLKNDKTSIYTQMQRHECV